ncbi:MAG TPA: hypothetical protein VN816_06625 [Acidimicrobiales bacterium]|nr:hypothetical protein [Acidimicrobiales bacterium]
MTTAARCGNSGAGTPDVLPADVDEMGTGPVIEDVVRLGDEHVRGVESLCVGESQ